MRFAQEFIDRVRKTNDIAPLISSYVPLQRKGLNFKGKCPFHEGDDDSLSVSERKQVFYCVGCQEAGGVIQFVQRYHGLTFSGAVEFLAKRARI